MRQRNCLAVVNWQAVRPRSCHTGQNRRHHETKADAEHGHHAYDPENHSRPDRHASAHRRVAAQCGPEGRGDTNDHQHYPREDVPHRVVALDRDDDEVDRRCQGAGDSAGKTPGAPSPHTATVRRAVPAWRVQKNSRPAPRLASAHPEHVRNAASPSVARNTLNRR